MYKIKKKSHRNLTDDESRRCRGVLTQCLKEHLAKMRHICINDLSHVNLSNTTLKIGLTVDTTSPFPNVPKMEKWLKKCLPKTGGIVVRNGRELSR